MTQTASTPALRAEGLQKSFDGNVVVDDVSFTLQRGEIFALLGPSGCGKSTTLRMLAGLETPDEGRILLGDDVVNDDHTVVPPEQRHIGLVFQQYALFPHLDVTANVAFGVDDKSVAVDMVQRVGLQHRADAAIHDLSGGEQQRVALARALAPKPSVVLLDEPFANLDASLRQQVQAEVRSVLQQVQATALVVTHDQQEALAMADRVGVMWQGRLLQVATPQELYHQPASPEVAAMVGAGSFLPATCAAEGAGDPTVVTTTLGALAVSGGVHGGTEGRAFVRPHQVKLGAAGQKATVTSCRFFGDHHVVTVDVDGVQVVAHTSPADGASEGDEVFVDVVGEVVFFADGGSLP